MSRLLSIDVFRGITVAFMILVNCAGIQPTYTWLMHSDWNGCTFADLVFPFFIWMVGVSVAFSLSKLRDKGVSKNQLLRKILKRAVFLFLLGLLLNAYPRHLDFSDIRILGVLQRIAICYLVVSLLYLTTNTRTQIMILVSLLICYWLIMVLWASGFGVDHWSVENNLVAYIDQLVIGSNHLHTAHFDPEGLLSTLPAIATALLGSCLGSWLLSEHTPQEKLKGMFIVGFIIALLGWCWGMVFPINKSLWTSSYVLWTGGLALLMFACCYWIIDIKQWKIWSKPFEIFGINALTVFVLHVVFLKTQFVLFLQDYEGHFVNLKTFFMKNIFGWASLESAALLYGLANMLFWFGLIVMYQHKKQHHDLKLLKSNEYLTKIPSLKGQNY